MTEPHTHVHSYTDWCAIVAGTVLAIAISLVLLHFGSAVGLADNFDASADTITSVKVLTIGIWLLWVQLLASLVGGYVTGRLRTAVSVSDHEREMRDGMHGLLVWASSTVLVAIGAAAVAAFSAISAGMTGNAGEAEASLTEAAMRISENSAIIFAFGAGATSLISAAVAWWAATCGGDHRDRNTDLSVYFSFRHR